MKEDIRKGLQLFFMFMLVGVASGGMLKTMKQHGIEINIPVMIV